MKTQQTELIRKTDMYERLCELYPRKTSYLQRHAELLIRLGRNFHAQTVLNNLLGLLQELGDTQQAQEVERLIASLEQNELTSHTYLSSIFRQAEPSLVDKLVDRRKQIDLKQGDYLFRQGEQGRAMYIVLEGELSVWRHFPKSSDPILLENLEKGDTIGEIAFVHGGERIADVLANQDSIVLKLTSSEVMKQMLEDPAFETALHNEANIRHHMALIAQNPELRLLPLHLRRFIAEGSRLKKYGALKRIAAAGKKIASIGIVTEGKVSIALDRPDGRSKVRQALSPGDMFGESAAVADVPSAGSLTYLCDYAAIHPCEVLYIPLGLVRTAIKLHPPLKLALGKLATQHMNKTIQMIREMSD